VQVGYGLDSTSPVPFSFALGAQQLVRNHRPLPGLADRDAEPRSAVGISDHGHILRLLTTDGREGTGSGLTLRELAQVLARLGCDQGVHVDGGGSATLVTRDPTSSLAIVRNSLAGALQRPVPNGIAILTGPAPATAPAPAPAGSPVRPGPDRERPSRGWSCRICLPATGLRPPA
jgi:hypothetical protein